MSRVNEISLAGVTADDNGIAETQTPAAGGVQSLTLTGVNPPSPMIIDITSVGDETSRVFTITGLDRRGEEISEAVAGANAGVAQSTKQFASISSITVDDDTAGAVIVGWAAVLYSQWFPLNTYPEQIETLLSITVTGTVNFDLEYTYDGLQGRSQNTDRFDPLQHGDIEANLVAVVDADIDGDTASIAKTLTTRATALRLKINSGTGSLLARIIQAGNR